MQTNRIALGTVQFGLNYGIANPAARPDKKDVFNILEFAYKEGINTLDTAHAYGESEKIIGEFIAQSGKKFNIISKMPDLEGIELNRYFRQSLGRLRQKRIYGYLIHKFDNFFKHKRLWSNLQSLKKKGLVRKIGVSLYRTEELDYLLENNIRFDILQMPYSIFDQRFEEYLDMLRKKRIEIYARSIFLQGLFFLKMPQIKKRFQQAKNNMEKLYRISKNYKIPIYSLCLGFVLLNPLIDKIIIGVDSVEQLKQNISSFEHLDKVKKIYSSIKPLEIYDEALILPYNWQ